MAITAPDGGILPAAVRRDGRKDPGREVIPIYRYQTARLAEIEREGYSGPRLIWFYCSSCAAREDSRLVEFELEVAPSPEEKLEVEAFVHRRPTIAQLLARITRDQAEQLLAAFSHRENAGILNDICRAPEDGTRVLYDPKATDRASGSRGG